MIFNSILEIVLEIIQKIVLLDIVREKHTQVSSSQDEIQCKNTM